MVFRVFLAFLICHPNRAFCKDYSLCMGIAIARYPIFKIVSFPEYLVFFRAVFCTEQLYCPFRMVFRIFLAFLILTLTEHFAKALAFAWAIAFARWPIFRIVSFLEYFIVFSSVFFSQNNSIVLVEWVFACF